MSGFTVYKDYLAIKLHFTSSYDYPKYNGKTNRKITIEAFEKKPFRFIFTKLSKKRDYHDFLIAILCHNPTIALDELTSKETEDRYTDWKKRTQSLSRFFIQELKSIEDDFHYLVKSSSKTHPPLFKHYLTNDISLETLCILLTISKMKKEWDEIMQDPLWTDNSLKIDKYTPFLSYDINKMKAIAYEKFQHAAFCA